MAKVAKHPEGANVEKHVVGVYIAYDIDGKEIWRKDDYEIGHDQVPTGISICMKAMKIVNPKSGEVLKQWNPWDVV